MNKFNLRALVASLAVCTAFAVPNLSYGQETIRSIYMNRLNAKDFIRNVERESNDFRATYEKRYKTMFVSNWRRTDESKVAVQNLDKALEKVYKRSVNEKPRYIRDDVIIVLKRARELDRMFVNPDRVLATMDDDWHDLKAAINDLARMYELQGLD